MAPKTRAKSAKGGAKDPIPKQTIKSKLDINTREDDSQNTKRWGHCGASAARSEDMETALQDTVIAAATVSAGPLDSRESAEVPSPTVLPEWNGRRRRTACDDCRRRRGLPTTDELEVAEFLVTEDFRSKWASVSASDVWVAAATMAQMKKDPN